jgi:hypothetical protein
MLQTERRQFLDQVFAPDVGRAHIQKLENHFGLEFLLHLRGDILVIITANKQVCQ